MVGFGLLLTAVAAEAATLAEAVASASASGVDVQLVAEQRFQAETLRGQAWALLAPKVQLNGSYTINEYDIVLDFSELIPEELAGFVGDVEPTTVMAKEYFSANASVVQPLFSGSALPLLRGATATIDASRAQERLALDQIGLGVARAYYGVIVAREGVRLAELAVTNAAAHAALAEAAVKAGTAPPTARLQGQIAVARAEREREAAHEGRVVAEQALSKLTGLPADTPVELPTPPVSGFGTADEAIAAANGARPAIRVAEDQARAAQHQLTATRLGWLPSVDGRFTWNYTENTGFANDPSLWMVVFEGKWTLWDGGFRIADQQRVASVARMATLAVDRARLEAAEQIRTLFERQERAAAATRAVERELELAKENVRVAEAAFAAGTLTLLELEDARLGLQAAEMARLTTRMERDLAVYELGVAVGRTELSPAPATPPAPAPGSRPPLKWISFPESSP
jgi:outer membrane protein